MCYKLIRGKNALFIFNSIMLLFASAIFTNCQANFLNPNITTTQSDVEWQLNSSPKDINQLLSALERENKSLIEKTPLTPVFDKIEKIIDELSEQSGLDLGSAYIPLYQHADHSKIENAQAAEAEIFGRWHIFGEKNKSPMIGFKIEQKHRSTQIFPSKLAEQFNSIIKTVSGYEQLRLSITELWLQTSIIPNIMAIRIGKINLSSVMNSYAFDSRQFYFLSDVFSSEPAINKPQKGLGAITAIRLSKHYYVSAGIMDLNGQEGSSGFRTLHRGEFIKAIEFGYRDRIITPQSDNYHIFFWQSDAQKSLGIPSDSGWSLVLQKNFYYRFIPFFKMNLNGGQSKDIKQLYIAGFGFHYPFNGEFGLLGFALGYAVLSDKTLGHQFILESFYRIQLTKYSQLTPDIQFIRTPHNIAFNEQPCNFNINRWVPVFSLRYRIAV